MAQPPRNNSCGASISAPQPDIATFLRAAADSLTTAELPWLEAEILLAHTLRVPRSYLRAWPERLISAEVRQRCGGLLRRRRAGEPIAYLTGCREFWSQPLEVNPDTLIPRPETELLVEQALTHIPAQGSGLWLADMGTGCGAIALALASERSALSVIASDVSAPAIATADRNCRRLRLTNVLFVIGNWCDPLASRRFDIIVSNPPYIEDEDTHLHQGDLRFEPRLALAGGPDGLAAIRTLTVQAQRLLRPGGRLLLEHGHEQGNQVRRLFESRGYQSVRVATDVSGNSRVTQGRWPGGVG